MYKRQGLGLKADIRELIKPNYTVIPGVDELNLESLVEVLMNTDIITEINDVKIRQHLEALIDIFLKSQSPTIDTFLSRRSEYEDVGKLIITLIVRQYEIDNVVGYHDSDDWIQHLLNSHFNSKKDVEEKVNDFPTIITFNYDRHLEISLLNFLMWNFDYSMEDSVKIINEKMDIRHVYGKLGTNYDVLALEGVKYKNIHNDYKLIETIRSNALPNQEYNKIISEVSKVYILGFGFDKTNFDLLFGNIEWETENRNKYLSTGYGLAQNTLSWIQRKARRRITMHVDLKSDEFFSRFYQL